MRSAMERLEIDDGENEIRGFCPKSMSSSVDLSLDQRWWWWCQWLVCDQRLKRRNERSNEVWEREWWWCRCIGDYVAVSVTVRVRERRVVDCVAMLVRVRERRTREWERRESWESESVRELRESKNERDIYIYIYNTTKHTQVGIFWGNFGAGPGRENLWPSLAQKLSGMYFSIPAPALWRIIFGKNPIYRDGAVQVPVGPGLYCHR